MEANIIFQHFLQRCYCQAYQNYILRIFGINIHILKQSVLMEFVWDISMQQTAGLHRDNKSCL